MPQKPPLIADIRFTNQQVELATLAGVDTTAWKVNDDDGYLNGCIEFYDDTETQDKSLELFVTRSSTSKVPKFWSFIDFHQRSTRTSTF